MEELQRFGTHTRQRKASLTELGRKWLVLHSGGGAPAYALVANDWALMEARTHSPPLASYLEPVDRAVDPATFVWITKNGFAHTRPLTESEQKQWPHLAQMCETLWPRPIGEEAWQDWERRDHWKERAYFLATMGSRARPQFYGMVKAIYHDGNLPVEGQENDRDAIADLYTKLQRYGADEKHWPSAREMGSFIATLDLDHMEKGADCVEARRLYLEEKKQEEAASHVEETIENVAPVAMELDPIHLAEAKQTAATLDQLDQHAGLKAFRQRHLIPPTFDQRATAKQLVLASMGVSVPSHLMASAQRRAFGSFVKPEAGECNPELVGALLNNVSHTQLVSGLNLVSPALQTYYWSQRDCGTMTAHDFVGRLISEYVGNGADDGGYKKNYPVPDESLIKIITGF